MRRHGFSSFGVVIRRNVRAAPRGYGLRALSDTVEVPASDVLSSKRVAFHAPTYYPFQESSAQRRKGTFSRAHVNIGVDNFTMLAVINSVRAWRFVRVLANAPSEDALFVKTLNECAIPRDVYEHYKPVIVEPSFTQAVASLDDSAPDWLFWHLFMNRTVALEEAINAARYAESLQGSSERVAGCMVLAMHALVWHGASAPAAPLLSAYLERKDLIQPSQGFYVNSMLLATSRFERSDVFTPLIERLVLRMRACKVPFSKFALEYFLASKSTTLERMRQVHDIIQANNPNEVQRVIVQNYLTILQREGPPGSVAHVLRSIVAPWDGVASSNPEHDTQKTRQESEPELDTEHQAINNKNNNSEVAVPTNGLNPLPHFPNHTPPKAYEQMTTFDWITYVSQVARDTNVNGDTLISLFQLSQDYVIRTTRDSSPGIQIRRKLLPSVLSGLIRRKEVQRAIELWEEYIRRHLNPETSLDGEFLKPDKVILGAGVHTLASAGRITDAFSTLNELALRVGEAQYTGGRSLYSFPSFDPGDPIPKPRVPLSVPGFNALLFALLARRRPDIIFALWDMAERVWGVAPDSRSLLCLITAATHAARMHARRPVREEMQYIRFRMRALLMPWSRTFTSPRDPVAPRGSPDDPALLVSMLLKQSEPQGTLWRGVPAWQRARYIFRSVILGNWPNLASIAVPAVAVRENDAAELAPPDVDTSESRSKMDNDADISSQDEVDADLSTPRTLAKFDLDGEAEGEENMPALRYPFLVPSAHTFHVYILMLGQVGLASEIALSLAWMRALSIKPRTDTLKIALVYWRQVTDDAPSMEFYKDFISKPAQRLISGDSDDEETPAYGSGYMDLVRWLKEWVPNRMPTDEDLLEYERNTRSDSYNRAADHQ